MKCQDIERLIIDSSEEDFTEEERERIEEHLAQCPRCHSFQDDLKKIRTFLKEMTPPSPPAELARCTQLLCYTRMRRSQQAEEKARSRIQQTPPIPVYIWGALVSLTILTLILTLPLIEGLTSDQPLQPPMFGVLVLMIQNAVMLCFSPILLRKYRMKNQDFESPNNGANAF